ncbi:hypothetical protein J6590_053689 [Homalodisca vitripennis]|nr:hypothetical protein J6590_053689 [Homalodisca vitripennis]
MRLADVPNAAGCHFQSGPAKDTGRGQIINYHKRVKGASFIMASWWPYHMAASFNTMNEMTIIHPLLCEAITTFKLHGLCRPLRWEDML